MLDLILEDTGLVDSDLFLIKHDLSTNGRKTENEAAAAAIKGDSNRGRSSVDIETWSGASKLFSKMKLLVVLFAVLAVSSAGLAALVDSSFGFAFLDMFVKQDSAILIRYVII